MGGTDTEATRSRRRLERIAVSSGAAIGARALGVAVSVLSIPLVINYLGPDQFGLWVTISALTSLLAFTDLGLGNGLLNLVSEAEGSEDKELARRAISTTVAALGGVAAAVAVLGVAITALVPWHALLGISSATAESEFTPALAVYIILFAVGLPLSVAERTRVGLQRAYVNSFWSVVGSLAALSGTLYAVSIAAPLPQLILLSVSPPVIAAAASFGHLFWRQHPDLRPGVRWVTPRLAPRLLRLGVLFVALQLATAIAFQSDVVVAAIVLGPSAAASYAVASRVFLFAPSLIAVVLLNFWPAYGEALARGDTRWVVAWVRRSTVFAGLTAGAISAVLLVSAPMVFGLLTGDRLEMPTALLVGFAVWATISSAFNAVAMLLNAASVLAFQVVVALLMAAASICLSILLAAVGGVAGVIWGTVVAYVLITAIPVSIFMPRLMRRLAAQTATTPAVRGQ